MAKQAGKNYTNAAKKEEYLLSKFSNNIENIIGNDNNKPIDQTKGTMQILEKGTVDTGWIQGGAVGTLTVNFEKNYGENDNVRILIYDLELYRRHESFYKFSTR